MLRRDQEGEGINGAVQQEEDGEAKKYSLLHERAECEFEGEFRAGIHCVFRSLTARATSSSAVIDAASSSTVKKIQEGLNLPLPLPCAESLPPS